jgi:hypothetical protein
MAQKLLGAAPELELKAEVAAFYASGHYRGPIVLHA